MINNAKLFLLQSRLEDLKEDLGKVIGELKEAQKINKPDTLKEHIFGRRDICRFCGCSKRAVKHFKFSCNDDKTKWYE